MIPVEVCVNTMSVGIDIVLAVHEMEMRRNVRGQKRVRARIPMGTVKHDDERPNWDVVAMERDR